MRIKSLLIIFIEDSSKKHDYVLEILYMLCSACIVEELILSVP